ncbi:50S ribosomal protein L24 [Candidatus Falkowbacteria bacterium CG_4_10_14_0_2_um_filter_48_10]|uniref:Large ribosomal subunit protein uL24 n=1 Tax=Candidatus Falkowbacteria bacterium CG23_combo_of_CG06-09_8_20_14_all_49_15 TaxID=1974572 RepID=A0A2G9ZJY5_9BACT|nr:MAG: 50S ribosomal protein L24 [Candidatus Falkowbacteria bacterium CG23_combo_of_CG06-09_8_20_14_all_49_15]PJA09056.1 MAG: 50S ribosomal protein L24 [Candidatus Falkowbacteria bacterium CG_4_10_14_0_2_um_filter_48_10]
MKNIKKGDKVKIIGGKDRGKTGKVLQVFPRERKVSVEGLNLLIKHLRPRRQGEKGQRIEFPAPLTISNAMLVCPKCGRPTKPIFKTGSGQEKEEADKKSARKRRYCRHCEQAID